MKASLAQRPSHLSTGEVTGDSSFAKLIEIWLDDLDMTNKPAPSTRSLYERNMRQLVMPAFEHYVLREITVRKVVNLADGTMASEGDLTITRHNDRHLHTLRGDWVGNGDRWAVTRVHKDGSMQVQCLGTTVGGSVTLPAAYVAAHVDLGYAVTAHRAQGMTVDTSHVVVTGSTTRENLYVWSETVARCYVLRRGNGIR